MTAAHLRKLLDRSGSGIPKPQARRKRLTYVQSDFDGQVFSTRCDYCGGWWKTYQKEHHNLKDCPMRSEK